MPDHQNMPDAEHIDRKQKSGVEIVIAGRHEIGDVAMDEHLARIEIDNLGRWYATI